MTNGRKTRPSWRQRSAVSHSFLLQALSNAAPALTAAAATFVAANGPVTVTSMAPSFPLAHRRIMTSPGLAFTFVLGMLQILGHVDKTTLALGLLWRNDDSVGLEACEYSQYM